ncbi:hypothetical protein IFM89_013957 [Coptis chinensis]|uniref:Beta-glucosidase n=1 Tax=Coptis chinensis TaxID=261450 RepID=A0A835HCP3_9MAGN|nr:hypothetical protein IFM89_013957 [Coptis chinensis]
MSPQNTLKSHIDTGGVSVRGQLSFARESRKISKLFPPIPELKATPEGEIEFSDVAPFNIAGLLMTSDDSSNPTACNDTVRIKLLQIYRKKLHPSIRNGSNLRGYFLWSFLDVFQVAGGYTSHFGLYGVDFHDKERRRYPRQSVEWYSTLT